MSATAQFHCITTDRARTETFADGEVEFTPTAVYLTMQMPECTMRIGVSDDVTTITRLGKDNYTLVLSEGKRTVMDLGFIRFAVCTQKIRFKKTVGKIDLMIKYNYGDDEDCTVTMLVHAVYDECER